MGKKLFFADSPSPRLPLCSLNLIWTGSELSNEHVSRIKLWKKKNLHVGVYVWVDSEFINSTVNQLNDNHIQVKCLSGIVLSGPISDLVQKLSDKTLMGVANYAAKSDILRFFILEQYPGWYVDTDVLPIYLSIRRTQCVINGGDAYTCPDVLFIPRGHKALRIARNYLDALARQLDDTSISLIRNTNIAVRYWSTTLLVGGTGYAIRLKLAHDHVLFCLMKFQSYNENSWIFSDKDSNTLLNGIDEGEKSFLHAVAEGKNSSIYTTYYSLAQTIRERASNLDEVNESENLPSMS